MMERDEPKRTTALRFRIAALCHSFTTCPIARSRSSLFVVVLALGTGCDRPPSPESLKEWTPADHHSQDDDRAATQRPRSNQRPQAPAGGADVDELVDLAWRQQCSTCHGAGGKGDGQLGPMVRAPDLTRDDWQANATDAQIADAIRNGKGKMPRFDVPEPVLRGLVARVRATKGR
jgi:mono/diheme cytochrome c family protein